MVMRLNRRAMMLRLFAVRRAGGRTRCLLCCGVQQLKTKILQIIIRGGIKERELTCKNVVFSRRDCITSPLDFARGGKTTGVFSGKVKLWTIYLAVNVARRDIHHLRAAKTRWNVYLSLINRTILRGIRTKPESLWLLAVFFDP